MSGWGLVDVIGVTAYDTGAQRTVTFLMDAVDGRGVRGQSIALASADASSPVELVFDGCEVSLNSVMHVGGTGGSGLALADRLLLRINGSLGRGQAVVGMVISALPSMAEI
ncbi:hypothetical protein CJ179_47860 [Rhodococcus sp. ACS1]|uniref:hypothetical protein n=1 Tax=Rhodococcus sp. ACS1 TaxID=2028570 RepID=UPI000BB0FF49|nr:hypothetical protein [Rhodococcus sp. ACS1]PBC35331.1 hypothetical protein CJ179_47860 [Rhodococcus sp. ACS1]